MRAVRVFFPILFLAAFQAAAALPADSTRPKGIPAIRITEQMSIDGILSESLYQTPGFSTFTQRDPNENAPPTERTEVWIGYDDGSLYVGARMYDSAPDSIERRLARKDATIAADAFTFYIDGYHDKQSGFYFGLNAAGTLYDGVLYNDDWDDDTWDGIWEGKVHVDHKGWTVEMRIPYSQIRFRLAEQEHWAVNFKRVIARKNENDYVAFTPKNGSGFVSRFVDLTGIGDIDPPRRLEILPYLRGKAEFAPHDARDPFHNGSDYSPDAGVDFKLGIGSNLTLDGAVNPDFGQVEVDPAVVNLSDVETFFDEKRPFFLEGSSIFQFGRGGASNNWSFNWSQPTFFYSRRIGRAPQGTIANADFADAPVGTKILGAAKLSGKTSDSWSLGAISVLTAREIARIDSAGVRSDREVEPLTSYNLFRTQKEINDGRQGIGALLTFTQRAFSDAQLRDQINANALVAGLDGWTALDGDKTWVVTFWSGLTRITGDPARILAVQENSEHYYQRPDASYLHLDSAATSLAGYSGRMFITKQKGNFFANGSLGVISPGFDVTDLGFQWRTDVINMHSAAGYKWTVPASWYRSIELALAGFQSYDFGGDVIWRGVWGLGDVVLPNYYEVSGTYAYNPQTISTHLTRGGPKTITPPGYEISGTISGDSRNSFIPGLNFDVYHASYTRNSTVTWTFDWKPASNIEVVLAPEIDRDWEFSQWVGAFSDPTATSTYGKRYVYGEMDQTTLVAGVRLNWSFTPQLSLQTYVQPLLSAGTFRNFKELARPGTFDFVTYGVAGTTITGGSSYTVDPDGAGPAAPFSFSNPDFNFKSLRGDAVLRWEFVPGSTLYLVWTQSRTNSLNAGDPQFRRDLRELFRSQPDNIFLMKIAYWLNP